MAPIMKTLEPFSALHTDLYQLTMAQGYWKLGMHQKEAVFELFFRHPPFSGGYAVASGLQSVIEWLLHYHFTEEDITYLSNVKTSEGFKLFEPEFLQALLSLQLTIDLDAVVEGTIVFAREPLIRVTGQLWQCQLMETLLLNLINFPTLIATKASRVCKAAGNDAVIDFGLRRAQGPDGGLTASRAAFVGGATATSNVLAGMQFGIPVVGTHAHSWIMAFESELESFEAYASVMPQNSILLVDTYESIEGVKNAIKVGLNLKKQGHRLLGIRLDSGDLAALSIKARKMLDEAGFQDAKIVGSSDLDEYAITNLKKAGAKISLWGVGTRMVTGYDQPALGGVYKLMAIKDKNESNKYERLNENEELHKNKRLNKNAGWHYKIKRSDDPDKHSVPGIHGVLRIEEQGQYIKDIVYDIFSKDALDIMRFPKVEDLLKPIFREGKLIYTVPTLPEIQSRTKESLKKFPESITALSPTAAYPVELPKEIL